MCRLLLPVILPLVALMVLSGCSAPGSSPWENVHQGMLYNNIYTGDDHI